MQQVVPFEIAGRVQCIDQRKRLSRTVDHCDCYRTIQRHNGRGLDALEKIIQPKDLRPIRIFGTRRLTMQRRNRRLYGKRRQPSSERLLDQGLSFGDLPLIPAATILFFENDEVACFAQACIAP